MHQHPGAIEAGRLLDGPHIYIYNLPFVYIYVYVYSCWLVFILPVNIIQATQREESRGKTYGNSILSVLRIYPSFLCEVLHGDDTFAVLNAGNVPAAI